MFTQIFNKQSFQKLFSVILLASIFSGAFSVSAQTGRGAKRTPANSKTAGKKTAPKCSGGWSGTITYTKTLDETGSSDEPGIRKGKDRLIQQWSHIVDYNGRMVVDGSVNPQMPDAFGKVSFKETRMQHGIEKVWDSCGAWKPEHWFIIDGKQDEIETGNGEGKAKSFSMNVNEFAGNYNFSFSLPDVAGKYSREDHTKREGHCQPQNNLPDDRSIKNETKINGEGITVDNQKIDPNNPNVLSGSVKIDDNDYGNPNRVKTPITVVSWKFKRCSPPLMITDVKFYQLKYPSPSDWTEIDSSRNGYTIDGNEVKIAATIVNLSGEQKSATVNFKDLTENDDLPEGKVAANFAPHEEKQVEYIWDTSGFAWKEDKPYNYAVNTRNIEVSIPDDTKTEQIAVYPKPVIILPGMWSKPVDMGVFVSYFKNQNVPWTVVVPPVYISKKAADNIAIIDKSVRDVQKKENAWHVDLVAHSTGGLMARSYINSLMPTEYDSRPTARHLIMLGVPNLGTPCSTGVDTIFTKIFSRQPEAFGEISPKSMNVFNQTVNDRRGTKFLALVTNTISPTCQLDEGGDGIVPFISGIYSSRKYVTTNVPHEDMLKDQTVFTQVRVWLAVPRTGNPAADNAAANGSFWNNLSDPVENNFGKTRNYGAMFSTENGNSNDGGDEPEPNFATGVKLAANQSGEIEIPVTNGSRFSLVLYAPPNVSAKLIDDKGEAVGEISAGNANGIFRTITIKKPFQNGKWKLKLENREQTESEIVVTAYIDYKSVIYQTEKPKQ